MLLTTSQIETLAQIHINRFRSMISLAKMGAKGYRLGECTEYLDIWEKTIFSVRKGLPIPESGKHEIRDAIYSGEYLQEFEGQEIEFPESCK